MVVKEIIFSIAAALTSPFIPSNYNFKYVITGKFNKLWNYVNVTPSNSNLMKQETRNPWKVHVQISDS